MVTINNWDYRFKIRICIQYLSPLHNGIFFLQPVEQKLTMKEAPLGSLIEYYSILGYLNWVLAGVQLLLKVYFTTGFPTLFLCPPPQPTNQPNLGLWALLEKMHDHFLYIMLLQGLSGKQLTHPPKLT